MILTSTRRCSRPIPKQPRLQSLTLTQLQVLHVAWHPQDDIVAVAANNNLYLYAADDDKDDSEL